MNNIKELKYFNSMIFNTEKSISEVQLHKNQRTWEFKSLSLHLEKS